MAETGRGDGAGVGGAASSQPNQYDPQTLLCKYYRDS